MYHVTVVQCMGNHRDDCHTDGLGGVVVYCMYWCEVERGRAGAENVGVKTGAIRAHTLRERGSLVRFKSLY